ncbi:UNVERIFIED_CONTAM: hypothetical protein NCL1_47183 [Trichonephila clavipes]
MMGQTLKDLDIEICPDNVHLCPGTAECCKGEDGKYDCCPKASVPIADMLFILLKLVFTVFERKKKLDDNFAGTVATNLDSSGLAVPHLYLNAIGGDAGGHDCFKHGP